MNDTSPNYTEAFEELQEIVTEIEQGEISVDELSEKVKRAALLIKICKAKLTTTEEDVNLILRELDSSAKDDEQAWSVALTFKLSGRTNTSDPGAFFFEHGKMEPGFTGILWRSFIRY